jgi:hypothetical protein
MRSLQLRVCKKREGYESVFKIRGGMEASSEGLAIGRVCRTKEGLCITLQDKKFSLGKPIEADGAEYVGKAGQYISLQVQRWS